MSTETASVILNIFAEEKNLIILYFEYFKQNYFLFSIYFSDDTRNEQKQKHFHSSES